MFKIDTSYLFLILCRLNFFMQENEIGKAV